MSTRLPPALLVLAALLAFLQSALCVTATTTTTSSSSSTNIPEKDRYVTYVNSEGETVYLKDDRRPSLYTGNYGDCLGTSVIDVTRFDAAYYKDNMTVLFHLGGSTSLNNESLVMYIGVYAYGESRFDLIFNPCSAGIESLCPLNTSLPIVASGIIPISEQEVSGIPTIALSIPNFEGEAILRVFANSTQSEIACYSAVVTNGNSFAHPASVGTVLGLLALITMIASFATAIYGEAVPTMRLHYAHSLSVGVVFAVYQHIFFTGALSMNWPSVLVAWWANFAWSGGMIYSKSMQNTINSLIGANIGSTAQVGAAAADANNNNVGGGFNPDLIYRRALSSTTTLPANHPLRRDLSAEIYSDSFSAELQRRSELLSNSAQRLIERGLQPRSALVDRQDGYRWYGHAVGPGMPLPGNYSGFAGTLAEENIPVSNAFMTGFLWFLALLAALPAAVIVFKWILELLVRFHRIEQDRLQFFRDHWIRYAVAVALRTCFVGFFLLSFLTIFEFTFSSSAGVKVIAAVVFAVFVFGTAAIASYAIRYKKHFVDAAPHGQAERKKLLGVLPWSMRVTGDATASEEQTKGAPEAGENDKPGCLWKRSRTVHVSKSNLEVLDNIHDNEDWTLKFGWLSSRFRRTRWWFFAAWLFYELVRAAFYAGASGHPLVQVFGILVVEFIAFVFVVWFQPFEGRRLNVLVVYCLGFSKVASVALSAAFDIRFNLPRITTTVIGIVIIVIQGILTVITIIAVLVGVISSYMSVYRNREDFRPRRWQGIREKYFDHLDHVVNDLPREPKPKKRKGQKSDDVEPAPAFEMRGMKRQLKIEDEDEAFASEMRTQDAERSRLDFNEGMASAAAQVDEIQPGEAKTEDAGVVTRSRADSSLSQTNLPKGARGSRPSWNAHDFVSFVPPREEETAPRSASLDVARAEEDSDVKEKKRGHRRTFSAKSNRKSAPIEEPVMNLSSLRIGGAVSTRDTIGDVPMPPVTRLRPESMRHSWAGSLPDPIDETDDSGTEPALQRSGKHLAAMTPAREQEEWLPASQPQQHEESGASA